MKVPGLRSKLGMLRSQKIELERAGASVRVLEPDRERQQILYGAALGSTGEDLVLKKARQQLHSHTLDSGKRSHKRTSPVAPAKEDILQQSQSMEALVQHGA